MMTMLEDAGQSGKESSIHYLLRPHLKLHKLPMALSMT